MIYDRVEAGHRLANQLQEYKGRADVLVLAIPRGGIVVGDILARDLDLDLDVVLSKKIGHPANPEYAIGVVDLHGEAVDEAVLRRDGISLGYIAQEVARLRTVLKRRYEAYRDGLRPAQWEGKTAIIADDGVATGHTLFAAVKLARREGVKKVVAAVPVGHAHAMRKLRRLADETVCLEEPEDFLAIGRHYVHFEPVEDEEAVRLFRSGVVLHA